jgi:hypothetical protein
MQFLSPKYSLVGIYLLTIAAEGAIFPVFFPVSRELGREEFASDCILRHLIQSSRVSKGVHLGRSAGWYCLETFAGGIELRAEQVC